MADTSISDTIPSHWFVRLLSQAGCVDLSNTDIINGEQLLLISAAQVAQNQISGNIPPCFGNFKAMITVENVNPFIGFPLQYGEVIIDDAKGFELKYTSTLMFMSSIDLSNNNISGEIPEELMDLCGLINLNLSGNHAVGRIPDRIGKMEQLESFDFSRNEL